MLRCRGRHRRCRCCAGRHRRRRCRGGRRVHADRSQGRWAGVLTGAGGVHPWAVLAAVAAGSSSGAPRHGEGVADRLGQSRRESVLLIAALTVGRGGRGIHGAVASGHLRGAAAPSGCGGVGHEAGVGAGGGGSGTQPVQGPAPSQTFRSSPQGGGSRFLWLSAGAPLSRRRAAARGRALRHGRGMSRTGRRTRGRARRGRHEPLGRTGFHRRPRQRCMVRNRRSPGRAPATGRPWKGDP